ncbi:hypothetical protein HDU84_003088 [Entophlyctis sp. JEL0112]|nr:hypothetical protein HDU84_003088 [Entophlyctis sp. JEL0112]
MLKATFFLGPLSCYANAVDQSSYFSLGCSRSADFASVAAAVQSVTSCSSVDSVQLLCAPPVPSWLPNLMTNITIPTVIVTSAANSGTTYGSESQFCPTYATQIYYAYQYLVRQANQGTANSGNPYYFTQPSLFKYGAGQWLWDSCGAIIANSRRNIQDAILEFNTLMYSQVSNGMVPEEISWPSGSGNTVSQMPVIPFALQAIYNQTGDINYLKTWVPKVANYLNWWRTTRSKGEGLVITVHPWETGIDASPAFDAAWHFTPTGSDLIDYPILYLKFPELQSYYANTWNNNYTAIMEQTKAQSSVTADWFMVEDIAINSLVAAGWGILGDMAMLYGDTANAEIYYSYNAAHEAAIKSKMWSASLGRFVTTYLDQDGTWQSSSVQTIQSLMPLLLRSLTSTQKAALISDATNPSKFWTSYPFPSVSKDQNTYHPVYVYNLLWRGPTWGLTNWLVIMGLMNQGRADIASQAVDKWSNMIQVGGVWEMYNPDTAAGYGAEGLGMSTTFVDMFYRFGKVNATNEYSGDGLMVSDLWNSTVEGSASGGSAFDDSWWYLSYGSNSAIVEIELYGGNRLDAIAVLYGDKRGSGDMYYSYHGDGSGSSVITKFAIPYGVTIVSTEQCIGIYGGGRRVFYVKFNLSNGETFSMGKTTSTCYTNTPPTGYSIVAIHGRSGSAVDAIGFWGH